MSTCKCKEFDPNCAVCVADKKFVEKLMTEGPKEPEGRKEIFAWFETMFRRVGACECCHYPHDKQHDAYICTESRLDGVKPIAEIFAQKYEDFRTERKLAQEQRRELVAALKPLANFGILMKPGEYLIDETRAKIEWHDTERARETLAKLPKEQE